MLYSVHFLGYLSWKVLGVAAVSSSHGLTSPSSSTTRTAIALPLRSNAGHSKHASRLIEETKHRPTLQKNTHAKTDSELTHSRFFRKSRPAQLSPMTRYPRARMVSDRKNCTKAAAPPPQTASTNARMRLRFSTARAARLCRISPRKRAARSFFYEKKI